MKYERLTEIEDNAIGMSCEISDIIDRLCELEDKIEDGTLVEMPCKVGDTVWFINEFVLFMGCPNIAIMCGRISKVIANISNEITYMYDVNIESALHATGYETHTVASGVIFLTKAEAEKRLEELRGKYDRNNQ